VTVREYRGAMARTTAPATGAPDGQLGLDLLDPGFGATALHRVTPARLDTWDACPRRYRMLHVDRPAPSRGGGFAHTTLGAVVHLALCSLAALPVERRTPEQAAALVDRHWTGEGFADDAQAARYRERARDWLAAAVDGPVGRDEPLAVERWVRAPAGPLLVEGRVDRIDGRDGEAVVVDFKTGRRVPTAADAAASRQLALYAVATASVFRRPCRTVELQHVPTGTVAVHTHDQASLDRHVAAAAGSADAAAGATTALADGGDADTLFPVRTGAHCGTCAVRRHCAPGRAAVPEPRPWDLLAP
jgi:putative RecB family exonuclease